MTGSRSVAVIGAGGCVGSAVVQALEARGTRVVPVRAPRLRPVPPARVAGALDAFRDEIGLFAQEISGADAVVNAAGVADATSGDLDTLTAANGLLPGFVGAARRVAGVPRYVHVSSAAVQGRLPLDSTSAVAPGSPYARSKALGERLARESDTDVIVYRPPGVHGPDRAVSRSLARLARSRLAFVARPGSAPSPQALLPNVADAIAFLATTERTPPSIVAHPSEGLTTASLLQFLGARPPGQIPRWLARTAIGVLTAAGRAVPYVAATARRLEVLWLGQLQAESWLSTAGWSAPCGDEAWQALGAELAARSMPPVDDGRED